MRERAAAQVGEDLLGDRVVTMLLFGLAAPPTTTVPGGALSNGWGIRWRARAVNTATQVTSAWSDWQTATIDAGNVPSEPGVSALQITPSQVVDDTTVATSLTPQLRAQVTNPAGGTMRAEFELEHDPAAPEDQGTGQIWTTAVDDGRLRCLLRDKARRSRSSLPGSSAVAGHTPRPRMGLSRHISAART
ncbi:hypothetical protein [Microbispora bryophytorum]|uniref:DNRLRE domain-containing protein n=1 Tax=Microbispora bryophytorum subsp. camponoti TaxID=1677852 RepID=A0ABR8LBM8_9ACTN|nr:hypothetical protein [Microbispora camponoti]MBD3147077.1 hypothetical protein [Microbispora camponoti]